MRVLALLVIFSILPTSLAVRSGRVNATRPVSNSSRTVSYASLTGCTLYFGMMVNAQQCDGGWKQDGKKGGILCTNKLVNGLLAVTSIASVLAMWWSQWRLFIAGHNSSDKACIKLLQRNATATDTDHSTALPKAFVYIGFGALIFISLLTPVVMLILGSLRRTLQSSGNMQSTSPRATIII